MKRFAELFDALDRTTSTNAKVDAIVAYLGAAPAEDAAWGLYFLSGQRMKRLLKSRQLWDWVLERTGLEEWLLGECYSVVGDSAETVSLLMGERRVEREPLALSRWIDERLMLLPTLDAAEQKRAVMGWWDELAGTELFLFNKLVTGEFRVGVSHRLVVRAVAKFSGVDEAVIAHRLTGNWRPTPEWHRSLVAAGGELGAGGAPSTPYPFFLASPLEGAVEELGPKADWLVEWKWDGIRAQLIRRGGDVSIWSRGDELVTDRFPEIRDAAARLPDGVVIDGEIMAYRDGPLPFALLQKRIGRQGLTAQVLAQAPAGIVVYDLMEEGGVDIRALPLRERRARLTTAIGKVQGRIVLSAELEGADWGTIAAARLTARERHVEGLMIKRLDSPYQVGRRRGDWWKWKIEPYSVDAVLVYAQPGHGRRANLLTDYTFAVWGQPPAEGIFAEVAAEEDRKPELVPFAKAYSGLSDEEIARLDRWIRQHTVERFGPVRAVEPTQVFELHFEGIAKSTRHKSGIAVRFPRIARWREDKRAQEADTLERVKGLVHELR